MEAEAPTGRVIRMAGDGHYSAQFTPDEIGVCGLTGVPVACRVFTCLFVCLFGGGGGGVSGGIVAGGDGGGGGGGGGVLSLFCCCCSFFFF